VLTPPLFIEVSVPSQESEQSCIYTSEHMPSGVTSEIIMNKSTVVVNISVLQLELYRRYFKHFYCKLRGCTFATFFLITLIENNHHHHFLSEL
jgi:hypothetical protein